MSRKLRILSYAINGRGMGHLVRQLAILRQVRRLGALLDLRLECWVLTSSEADTLARREGIPAIKLPSKAMLRDGGLEPHAFLGTIRSTVLQAVTSLQPDVLVVDTFPGGSVGELVPVLELVPHRVLVARRVREGIAEADAYQALLPLYQRTIVPDERGVGPILIRDRHELLDREEARRALGVEDRRAVYLSLGGGGEVSAPGTLPRLTRRLRDAGWHVVVGAGPLYTGEEVRGPGITWLSRYVPLELLPGVDAAVSAAGYNSFHELMYAGVPTVFLPLPRIADDQAARAERAVQAGAARLARTLDEVVDLLQAPGSGEAAEALVPGNGALEAAMLVLRDLVPEDQLRRAAQALTPAVMRSLARLAPTGQGPDAALQQAMDLVRVLTGGSPSEVARREALLSELAQQGVVLPRRRRLHADEALHRFVDLCVTTGAPFDTAVSLARGLDKKFPAADGPELLAACERLFPLWARFDDWMGAVSLMRAVPTQRSLLLADFVTELEAWLDQQDDLFDALRDFSRLEARGSRPVAEVLRLLREAP